MLAVYEPASNLPMLINGITLPSYLPTPVTLTVTLPVKSSGTVIINPAFSLTVTFNPIPLAVKLAFVMLKYVKFLASLI